MDPKNVAVTAPQKSERDWNGRCKVAQQTFATKDRVL